MQSAVNDFEQPAEGPQNEKRCYTNTVNDGSRTGLFNIKRVWIAGYAFSNHITEHMAHYINGKNIS